MIKIIDDWYVTVETNPTNYTVRRGTGGKDIRGKMKDKPQSYHTSLSSAVKAVRDQIVAEELRDGFLRLEDALVAVSEIDARFAQILEKVTA